jgi:hypothetical protein
MLLSRISVRIGRLAARFMLPLDQARLRPHLRGRGELEQGQAQVLREEFARARQEGIDMTAPRARGNDGVMVHPRELRGLPILARGVRGESPGSNPVAALLAKERRRG